MDFDEAERTTAKQERSEGLDAAKEVRARSIFSILRQDLLTRAGVSGADIGGLRDEDLDLQEV